MCVRVNLNRMHVIIDVLWAGKSVQRFVSQDLISFQVAKVMIDSLNFIEEMGPKLKGERSKSSKESISHVHSKIFD